MSDVFAVIFNGGTIAEFFNMLLQMFGLTNLANFVERWKAFFA